MPKLTRIKKGFDFLSPFYDFLLYITSGNYIPRSQLLLADSFPDADKVLILGGGTGTFLADLLSLYKVKKVVYVDISPGMIRQSKKRLASNQQFYEKVDFRTGSLDVIGKEEKFDFVITNYFLDVFPETELPTLISKLIQHLNEEGSWLVTDFHHGNKNYKNRMFRVITSLLYLFFRVVCGIKCKKLPDIAKIMKNRKLHLEKEAFMVKGLLRTAIYRKITG